VLTLELSKALFQTQDYPVLPIIRTKLCRKFSYAQTCRLNVRYDGFNGMGQLRQQHQAENIWMVQSVRKFGLKTRWGNLFAISAVTTIAFLSVGFAMWLMVASDGISII
jgi:hypothetical protein